MLNAEVIKERLEELDENLKILAELKEISKERFKPTLKYLNLLNAVYQIGIQGLLDICHYIIANNNWTRPKDNQKAIAIIARHKIIPEDFAQRIKPLADLRNILVHGYLKFTSNVYSSISKISMIFGNFKGIF